jgi:hypothetical protein
LIGVFVKGIRLGTAGAKSPGLHGEYSLMYMSSGKKSTMFGFLERAPVRPAVSSLSCGEVTSCRL